MSAWLALKGASAVIRIAVYATVLAVVAGLLWWAVGQPRLDLAQEEKAHAALKAAHEGLLTKLAEAEAAAEAKSLEVRTAYDAGIAASAKMREKEISDAYNRGKSAAAGIKSGAVSVRTVWRDRECPASAEGAGTGSGEGVAGVSGSRADLIGDILGRSGGWDATYSEAYRRLESAQKLLNACFDGVPVAEQ